MLLQWQQLALGASKTANLLSKCSHVYNMACQKTFNLTAMPEYDAIENLCHG
jgi:hypothetical protein